MSYTLRQNIWRSFVDCCIAFTIVSLLLSAYRGSDDLSAAISNIHSLQLFALCAVLSATQTAFDYLPLFSNRPVLRALANMLELFLLGGLVFRWFPLSPAPLIVAGLASLLAYAALWISIDLRTRRDAKDINEAIARTGQKQQP